MQQQQPNQPLYGDRPRRSISYTLIFALIIAFLGVVTAQPLLAILGIAFAAFNWVTNPRLYLIYPDSLVINYGWPRLRSISFREISRFEVVALPFGERMVIQLVNRRRVIFQTRDSQAFYNQLEGAVANFRKSEPPAELPDAGEGDRPST